MSDANRVRVVVGAETVFGTLVTTGDTMLVTGQALQPNIQYAQSRTLRWDRNVQDLVRLNLSAGGSLPLELYFDNSAALWKLMNRLLRNDLDIGSETAQTGLVANSTVNGATGTITGAGVGTNVSVGDIVRVTNTGTTTLNGQGFVRVLTSAAGVITVPVNTLNSVNSDTRRGKKMKNGTGNNNALPKSFTIEVQRLDVSKFETYVGMVPDSMSISIVDGQISTCSITFAGKQLSTTGNSTQFVTLINAAPVVTVMNCVDNVPTVSVAGLNYPAKQITINIANSTAARTQLGSLGPQSMRDGACVVTGSIQSYFTDYTELSKFLGDTGSDIVLAFQDVSKQAFAFSFPNIKWQNPQMATQGIDQDDFLTMNFMARYNANEGAEMLLEAFT
jgi:hypothetical protein